MLTTIPRIVLAALKGGAGKTLLSLGLAAAFRKRGKKVAAFKKGPDYIDAAWLGLAAGGTCFNLDPYLFPTAVTKRSFAQRCLGNDIAVIEGNRGLYDGVDAGGSFSTAELAKMLAAPVLLIVDVTKMTRTAAAVVLGSLRLDPLVPLRGVILNRVGGPRHDRVLRESIESATGLKVVGSVGKQVLDSFPQRHMGLVPLYENPRAFEFIDEAAKIVENELDLDAIIDTAQSAGFIEFENEDTRDLGIVGEAGRGVRIGIIRDSAFQFYYPENLEALEQRGAELVYLSALTPDEVPELDGLYIGGGFPETHVEQLANNFVFKNSLSRAVKDGLPVYAECGGLMYLSGNLCIDDNRYPMVGIFEVDSVLRKKPQGLGYIHVEVARPNPFYPEGTVLTGHEFHYSNAVDFNDAHCAFQVLRGYGMDGRLDGIMSGNALGTYMHIHALGEPLWADGIIRAARKYRSLRQKFHPAAAYNTHN